jgi:hypothetical protein
MRNHPLKNNVAVRLFPAISISKKTREKIVSNMADFLKNANAMRKTITAAGERPGSDIGAGTAEINKIWVSRLSKIPVEDAESEESQEEMPRVINNIGDIEENITSMEPNISQSGSAPPPSSSATVRSVRTIKPTRGLSQQEKKAMKEFDPHGTRDDSQISAFLAGFRIKQDYNAVALKAQIEQLQRVVDMLTSASTSVMRASSDIVEATASSTAKLAVSVTEHLEHVKIPKQSSKSQGPGVPLIPKDKRKKTEGDIMGKIEEVTLKNTEESARISEGLPPTAPVPELIVTPAGSPTIQDIAGVFSMTPAELQTFYSVTEERLKKVAEMFHGTLKEVQTKHGGPTAYKGMLKKLLSKKS